MKVGASLYSARVHNLYSIFKNFLEHSRASTRVVEHSFQVGYDIVRCDTHSSRALSRHFKLYNIILSVIIVIMLWFHNIPPIHNEYVSTDVSDDVIVVMVLHSLSPSTW